MADEDEPWRPEESQEGVEYSQQESIESIGESVEELSSSNQKSEEKKNSNLVVSGQQNGNACRESGSGATHSTGDDSDAYDDDFEEIDEESIAISVDMSLSRTSSPTHSIERGHALSSVGIGAPSSNHPSRLLNSPSHIAGVHHPVISPTNTLPAVKEKKSSTSHDYSEDSYGSASFRSSSSPKNLLAQSVNSASHYSDDFEESMASSRSKGQVSHSTSLNLRKEKSHHHALSPKGHLNHKKSSKSSSPKNYSGKSLLKLGEISQISANHNGGISSVDNSYSMDSFTNVSMATDAELSKVMASSPPTNSITNNLKSVSPSSRSSVAAALCPLTSQAIKEPAICIVDGYSYEKSAIEDWVIKRGTSPITQAPVSIHDIHSLKRLQEEFFISNQANQEAQALTQMLIGGGGGGEDIEEDEKKVSVDNFTKITSRQTPGGELANIPSRLLSLRKAAVQALHTFNHDQAVAKMQASVMKTNDDTKKGDQTEGGELLNTIPETGLTPLKHIDENLKAIGESDDDNVRSDTVAKPVVGVKLASALNDLELELLNAQRERKKQLAQERMQQREKRRRAEARRLNYEETLNNALKLKEESRAELANQITINEDLQKELGLMKTQMETLIKSNAEHEEKITALQDELLQAETKNKSITNELSETRVTASRTEQALQDEASSLRLSLDRLEKEFQFDKEMSLKAAEQAEATWQKRWESLPEHQAERLIEEQNLLSLREAKVSAREAACEANENYLRNQLRDELDGERRRFQRECDAMIANAKQLETSTKDRCVEMEKQAHGIMSKANYEKDHVDIKKEELENILREISKEKSKLQVDIELFQPRKLELESKRQINETKWNEIKQIEAELKLRQEAFEEQKGLFHSNFDKLTSFEEELKQKTVLIKLEQEGLKNEIKKIIERDRFLKKQHEKVKWMEHDIYSSFSELNQGMNLLQRFEKALILKAKLDHQQHEGESLAVVNKPALTNYDHNSGQRTMKANQSQTLSLVQQAAYTGALENELDGILQQIEQKLSDFNQRYKATDSFRNKGFEMYDVDYGGDFANISNEGREDQQQDHNRSKYDSHWRSEAQDMFIAPIVPQMRYFQDTLYGNVTMSNTSQHQARYHHEKDSDFGNIDSQDNQYETERRDITNRSFHTLSSPFEKKNFCVEKDKENTQIDHNIVLSGNQNAMSTREFNLMPQTSLLSNDDNLLPSEDNENREKGEEVSHSHSRTQNSHSLMSTFKLTQMNAKSTKSHGTTSAMQNLRDAVIGNSFE